MLFRAARYMHVAPWEMEERCISYRDRAIMFEQAELWAENEAMKRGRKGSRRR